MANDEKIKKCSKCNLFKSIDLFYRQKDKKDGIRSACKECTNAGINKKRSTTEYKEYLKKYYASDKYKARIKNRNETDVYKARLLEYKQTEKHKEYEREYKKKNLPSILKKRKERYGTDVQYRLSQLLRNRTHQAIKQRHKTGSAIRDLGCSLDVLMKHLENQFCDTMSWSNMGKWHIDHVVPLASFDLSDRNEYLKAVHYSNLQPMWEYENKSKGAKI